MSSVINFPHLLNTVYVSGDYKAIVSNYNTGSIDHRFRDGKYEEVNIVRFDIYRGDHWLAWFAEPSDTHPEKLIDQVADDYADLYCMQ